MLNSVITDPTGELEIKVEGSAREEFDHERLQSYSRAVARMLGWQPVAGELALFEIDLHTVTLLAYSPDTGEQHVARWPQRAGFIRPAVTPTSLGPPTAVRRVFEPE